MDFSIVVVTGMSGAGKSTTTKQLEDLGYYTIDNMPLPIFEQFVEIFLDLGISTTKLALVIDARTKDAARAFRIIEHLKSKYQAKIIFLKADDIVLVNRYKETRHKHPLGGDLVEAIAKERELLKDIKSISDIIFDTTKMSVHDLARKLNEFLEGESTQGMSVIITTFGFKHGVPVDSDTVLDVRFIKNPHFIDTLRDKTGEDADVKEFVLSDNAAQVFINKISDLFLFLLPQYKKEGKKYLKISIGCTGGKHRSVVIAGELTNFIRAHFNFDTELKHRDINR